MAVGSRRPRSPRFEPCGQCEPAQGSEQKSDNYARAANSITAVLPANFQLFRLIGATDRDDWQAFKAIEQSVRCDRTN
jgi:hypothetical protein